MIYLVDNIDLEMLEFPKGKKGMSFDLWETGEQRVKGWIKNERCRSLFSKQEILNLFNQDKLQMVRVDKIRLSQYDKIILWTPAGKYFVLEVTKFSE